MRTIPGPLMTALSAVPRRAAECVVLQARDGTVAGFTTWSSALTVDLSAYGGPGPVSCAPRMVLSATTRATGFDAGSFEMQGACAGQFTRAKVRGRKWHGAVAWQVRVSPGVAGIMPIMAGRVYEPRTEGPRFVLEVRDAAAAFNINQGNVLQPWCRADFGVASTGCPVIRTWIATTVTAVESAFVFALDLAGDHADNWFFLGDLRFTSGDLAGAEPMKVFAYDGGTAGVELFEPAFVRPQIGDACEISRGCSRLRMSDNPVVPTCLTYGAVEDFRAEPEVPGNRIYQRVSAPGSSYD
jgi:hypothetical protein